MTSPLYLYPYLNVKVRDWKLIGTITPSDYPSSKVGGRAKYSPLCIMPETQREATKFD